jgi:hypothetical protein
MVPNSAKKVKHALDIGLPQEKEHPIPIHRLGALYGAHLTRRARSTCVSLLGILRTRRMR